MCNSCHAGGTAPTVSIMGPATLMTGASATYTVMISGGAGVRAGFNAAASDGSFVAGAGTRVMGGEVTHFPGPGMFNGGTASFSFTYTAPATAGSITMFVAGLSASGGNQEMGDMAESMTFTIAVGGAAAGTDPVPMQPEAAPPMAVGKPGGTGLPGGVVEGGCSVGAGAPLELLALLMLEMARRRARKTR